MSYSEKRMKEIKRHFEREAKIFDRHFYKVAPFYREAIEALVTVLPPGNGNKLRIIDLGCGTGNITIAVKKKYPAAHVICIDFAENMINLAKAKLKKYRDVEFWAGDMRDYDYRNGCNAVVSSLVLHHIEGREKKEFYAQIYDALPKGGLFYMADFVLPSSIRLEKVFVGKWVEFMKKSLTSKQIAATLIKHKREDRPAKLIDELDILRETGFKNVDVIWKRYNFAIYGGEK